MHEGAGRMKGIGGKIVACLFVAVFSVAAAWLTYGLVKMLVNVDRAQGWQQVEGKRVSHEIVTSEGMGDHPDTQRLTALYRYKVAGKEYDGARVEFSPLGGDNFSGDRRLRQVKLMQAEPLVVYVDPQDPLSSVIDRSLPAEAALFITFFLVFPCGFATLILFSFAMYPIKPLRAYSGPVVCIWLGAPACYLLIRHLHDYGPIGAVLLMLIASLSIFGVYFIARRLSGAAKPAL
jgi:hypothetical protein